MVSAIVSPNTREQQRAAERRYEKSAKGKARREATKDDRARASLERYRRLVAAGLCSRCGKTPRRINLVYCEPCGKRDAARVKARRDKNVANGVCTACGKHQSLPSMTGKKYSLCERCYFKKTSTDCLKTAKYAEALGQKLHDQNYRCAYTGELIVLGLNDSLDHVLPISKFPKLRSDPTNVEWVTRKVNCMKWDSTREEFIATAYAVIRHYESQRQLVA